MDVGDAVRQQDDYLFALSPWRGFDWRARYLEAVAGDESRRLPVLELDPVITTVRSGPPAELIGTTPQELAAAVEAAAGMAQESSWGRTVLEALLLAGHTDEEISARTGVAPQVVRLYAELHYDCRSHRGAWFYILSRLGHCPPETQGAIEWLARYLAYFGGPAVLDAMLPTLGDFHAQDVSTAELRYGDLPFAKELHALLLLHTTELPLPMALQSLADFNSASPGSQPVDALLARLRGAAAPPAEPSSERGSENAADEAVASARSDVPPSPPADVPLSAAAAAF